VPPIREACAEPARLPERELVDAEDDEVERVGEILLVRDVVDETRDLPALVPRGRLRAEIADGGFFDGW
jgi:hypothetical protein